MGGWGVWVPAARGWLGEACLRRSCGWVGVRVAPRVGVGSGPRRGVSVLGTARNRAFERRAALTRQPLRADTPRHVPFPPYATAAPCGVRPLSGRGWLRGGRRVGFGFLSGRGWLRRRVGFGFLSGRGWLRRRVGFGFLSGRGWLRRRVGFGPVPPCGGVWPCGSVPVPVVRGCGAVWGFGFPSGRAWEGCGEVRDLPSGGRWGWPRVCADGRSPWRWWRGT
ncbi:hypothetical protein EASAB2608_04444 [Streptomyces sp. EAS-AB2608]|nr:hypothetical protein EASAB2608_04444 [Streptomyces sp. EAS-AB2608]